MPTTRTARIALICAIIYIAGMGVSNLLVYRVFGVSYQSADYATTLLPFIALLALGTLCAFMALRQQIPAPEGPRRYPLFLILFIPIACMSLYHLFTKGSLSAAFLMPLATSLLIGFAEEMMFRRILYVSLLQEPQGTQMRGALLISAVMFSLLHAVNVLAGSPLSSVIAQLGITFIAGLFYALMYEYTKSIVLLIINHSLWDYLLLSGAADGKTLLSYAVFALNVIEVFILIVLLLRKRKQEQVSPALNA